MYHYRPRRSKSDRPITFCTSVTKAAQEAPCQQQPTPDTSDAAPLTPEETPAPAGQQDTMLATLSPFDVQLCLFLLWWMRQQQAQGDLAMSEAPIDTIVVDGVVPPPNRERDEGAALPSRRRRKAFALVAGSLLCLLVWVAILPGFVFTAPASVTIIPTQTTLSTSATVTISTASNSPLGNQAIPGRILSTLTLTQAKAVPTTGIGQQAALAAHGQVTFYNAALTPQTIPAGTLLTGTDGVAIVTDQDAVIPVGNPPSEGHVTVPAHAVQVGPAGNIAANDLDGPCCREYVLVRNPSAFRGGQEARTYPMVTRHDLDSAVALLSTVLDQSVQAAYAAQLSPSEALVTPVGCMPHMTSSQQVGQEARAITVTLDDTCTGIAYDQQSLQTVLLRRMAALARIQLGTGYALLGDLQEHVQQTGTLTLTVQATGVWAYQFTEADLHHLSSLIAGKSQQQATALLLQQPGVGGVAMSAGTLPSDPQRIRVLILYRPV